MQSYVTQEIAQSGPAVPGILGIGEAKAADYNSPFNRCERVRIEVMRHVQELRSRHFLRALLIWLRDKKLHTDKPGTIECYRDYIKRLWAFFRSRQDVYKLEDVHIGHFEEYQRRNRKHYHPASVNHDLNVLSQVMRKAGLWEPIREHYRALPLPELDSPKVMSEAEENAFFELAARNKAWKLAYAVASITSNSTASGKELRFMKRGDVYLEEDPPYIQVPKNMKTRDRHRTIPLNERGKEMFTRILTCSVERGSTRPEHYIFAKRIKRNFFDPLQPASESWIKAQWKKLVDAALEAKVISFRIKPHNLRHQAITKLLDEGVPIEVVRQIAGHGVDSIITRHYHHGRMDVLKRAVDRINPKSTNGNSRKEGESA